MFWLVCCLTKFHGFHYRDLLTFFLFVSFKKLSVVDNHEFVKWNYILCLRLLRVVIAAGK